MSPDATRIGGAAIPLQARYPIEGVVYRSAAEARAQFDQGNWLNLNIADTLRAAAQELPDGLAVVDPEGPITFAELDACSESVAASLLALGLASGDRVLFQLGISKDYFTAYYGCMKAGVVPVSTLPQYRQVEMLHFAEKTSARAVFVQADVNPQFDMVAFAQEFAATTRTVKHVVVVRGEREGLESLESMATAFAFDEACDRTKHVVPNMLDVAVFMESMRATG